MKLRIEIHTLVSHVDYWLEFGMEEEQRATMAFLERTTLGNGRKGEGTTPFYLIENQKQQDALDLFLRDLGWAHRPSSSPLPA